MSRTQRLVYGLILLVLIAIILFFQRRFMDKPSLSDMWRDGGAWLNNGTRACFALQDNEIIMRPQGPFSPLSRYSVQVNNDNFFLQTKQTQYYHFDLVYYLSADIRVHTLSIDGDGPIPSGSYKYERIADYCSMDMLRGKATK
jgi:hypothetical protein